MDSLQQVKQDSELTNIVEELSFCSKCKRSMSSDLDDKSQVVKNRLALSSNSTNISSSSNNNNNNSSTVVMEFNGLNEHEEKPNITDLDKLASATTKSFSQVSLNGKASLLSDNIHPKCSSANNNDGQPCKKQNQDETESKSTKNQLKIAEKNGLNKTNSSTIVSMVLNRKKRLTQLANDIFRLSSYLDDIREAISVKEPSKIVKIPDPPIFDDYDSQFDFANQKRFGALPIRIQPVANNKKLSAINGENRRKVLANHQPSNSIKRLNNNGAGTLFHGRRSIKATGKSCKENQNNKNSLNITSTKKKIGDTAAAIRVSSFMYNYNPLKTPDIHTIN